MIHSTVNNKFKVSIIIVTIVRRIIKYNFSSRKIVSSTFKAISAAKRNETTNL